MNSKNNFKRRVKHELTTQKQLRIKENFTRVVTKKQDWTAENMELVRYEKNCCGMLHIDRETTSWELVDE